MGEGGRISVLVVTAPCPQEDKNCPGRVLTLQELLASIGFETRIAICQTASDLVLAVQGFRPDLAWSTQYYVKDSTGKNINTHRLLNELQVPVIGSSPEVLDLVLAKHKLKQRWEERGVCTPSWIVVRPGEDYASLDSWMDYPAIIKPCEEGNSRGLSQASIVFDRQTARSYLKKNLSEYGALMLEHYLGDSRDMREFTIAVIGNGTERLLLPAEIILNRKAEHRVITTSDKDLHHTLAIPVQDPELLKQLQTFARAAVHASGVEDYARLDVIQADGDLFAIEINGQPMLPDLWFDTCAKSAGLSREDYVRCIIRSSIRRWQHTGLLMDTAMVPEMAL